METFQIQTYTINARHKYDLHVKLTADCSNYQRMTPLSALYKILSNIFWSRLTPYVDEIIEDHQCGIWYNYWSDILHLSDTGKYESTMALYIIR
jgi:hypothetical protein